MGEGGVSQKKTPGVSPGRFNSSSRSEVLLRRLLGRAGMRAAEIIASGLHAALFERDAGRGQRHLGDAERADQRAVIDVAEMADAEVLAGILAEAGAVGDVEQVQ